MRDRRRRGHAAPLHGGCRTKSRKSWPSQSVGRGSRNRASIDTGIPTDAGLYPGLHGGLPRVIDAPRFRVVCATASMDSSTDVGLSGWRRSLVLAGVHWWSGQAGVCPTCSCAARFGESPTRERSAATVAACTSPHTRARTLSLTTGDDDVVGRRRLVSTAKGGMTGSSM